MNSNNNNYTDNDNMIMNNMNRNNMNRNHNDMNHPVIKVPTQEGVLSLKPSLTSTSTSPSTSLSTLPLKKRLVPVGSIMMNPRPITPQTPTTVLPPKTSSITTTSSSSSSQIISTIIVNNNNNNNNNETEVGNSTTTTTTAAAAAAATTTTVEKGFGTEESIRLDNQMNEFRKMEKNYYTLENIMIPWSSVEVKKLEVQMKEFRDMKHLMELLISQPLWIKISEKLLLLQQQLQLQQQQQHINNTNMTLVGEGEITAAAAAANKLTLLQQGNNLLQGRNSSSSRKNNNGAKTIAITTTPVTPGGNNGYSNGGSIKRKIIECQSSSNGIQEEEKQRQKQEQKQKQKQKEKQKQKQKQKEKEKEEEKQQQPKKKKRWTTEEDIILVTARTQGKKKLINTLALLPGRTISAAENRWTKLNKKPTPTPIVTVTVTNNNTDNNNADNNNADNNTNKRKRVEDNNSPNKNNNNNYPSNNHNNPSNNNNSQAEKNKEEVLVTACIKYNSTNNTILKNNTNDMNDVSELINDDIPLSETLQEQPDQFVVAANEKYITVKLPVPYGQFRGIKENEIPLIFDSIIEDTCCRYITSFILYDKLAEIFIPLEYVDDTTIKKDITLLGQIVSYNNTEGNVSDRSHMNNNTYLVVIDDIIEWHIDYNHSNSTISFWLKNKSDIWYCIAEEKDLKLVPHPVYRPYFQNALKKFQTLTILNSIFSNSNGMNASTRNLFTYSYILLILLKNSNGQINESFLLEHYKFFLEQLKEIPSVKNLANLEKRPFFKELLDRGLKNIPLINDIDSNRDIHSNDRNYDSMDNFDYLNNNNNNNNNNFSSSEMQMQISMDLHENVNITSDKITTTTTTTTTTNDNSVVQLSKSLKVILNFIVLNKENNIPPFIFDEKLKIITKINSKELLLFVSNLMIMLAKLPIQNYDQLSVLYSNVCYILVYIVRHCCNERKQNEMLSTLILQEIISKLISHFGEFLDFQCCASMDNVSDNNNNNNNNNTNKNVIDHDDSMMIYVSRMEVFPILLESFEKSIDIYLLSGIDNCRCKWLKENLIDMLQRSSGLVENSLRNIVIHNNHT